MAVKFAFIFSTLLLGCLAVPVPEDDMSIFFSETRQERIVGGSAAPNGAHPWMAAMTSGALVRSFRCGGSIVSPRTVLTAAHCIAAVRTGNTLPNHVRVTVGTNRWNQGGREFNLNGFMNHAQYNPSTIKNDIGVLYTATAIGYTNLIRNIPLNFDNVGGNIQARVAGWGAVRANGPAQAQLLQITVRTITGQQCINDVRTASANLNIRAPHIDPAIELCTFHSRGVGTCQGDSGSALVRIDRTQQIGIVSWGFPCALGAPDMYVRVSGFRNWLNQHIRN